MKKALSISLIVILLVSTVNVFAYEENQKISPYLIEKFNAEQKVKVEVYLEDPISHQILSNKKMDRIINEIDSHKIFEKYPEGFVAELTMEEVENMAKKAEVKYITPNILMYPTLNESVQIIDADLAWQRQVNGINLTGEGETVCVVDTGVDFTHPDLEAKNILGGNLDCGQIGCPLDPDMIVTNSHGTRVAGVVAANGGINGIGKGADLISANVYPNGAPSTYSFLMKRAVDWCVEHAQEYNISVITISSGSPDVYQYNCDSLGPSLASSINNAAANDIPVTIATGNAGSSVGISYPSCISSAVPVGGTTQQDSVYGNYNSLVKIFAPATTITSTCFYGNYCTGSGTSFSTPMVAGSIAIIKQYFELSGRQLNVEEIENLLHDTGEPIVNLPDIYKRININNALIKLSIGDLNDDGKVDTTDLNLLLGAWGNNPGHPADFTGDGVVDSADLPLLLGNWFD